MTSPEEAARERRGMPRHARWLWRTGASLGAAVWMLATPITSALAQPSGQPPPLPPPAQPPGAQPPPPPPPAPPALPGPAQLVEPAPPDLSQPVLPPDGQQPAPTPQAPLPTQPALAPAPPPIQLDPAPPPAPAAAARPDERRYHGGAANAYIGANNILRTTHAHVDFDLPVAFLGAESAGFDYTTLHLSVDPTVSLVDSGGHWLYVGTAIGNTFFLDVKAPRGVDNYVFERSLFDNVPLRAGYAHTFVDRDDGLFFRVGPEASVTFPTDAPAYVDLYTALGAKADTYLPLADGDAWNGLFLRGSVRWSHAFLGGEDSLTSSSRVNGAVLVSDTIGSAARFAPRDSISLGIAAWLNVWRDLSVGSAWSLALPFNYPSATEGCLMVTTGCVPTGGPVERNAYTGYMQLSLSYLFARMIWAELAYSNASSELQGEGGIFYSPSASVSVSATLLIDQMVERIRH